MVYDYKKRRRSRGGGKRNRYGQVVTVGDSNSKIEDKKDGKQPEDDSSSDQSNGRDRHFSHPHGPDVLSYPIAVGPSEDNGTRLLIKCFEYVPPKTNFDAGYSIRQAEEDGTVFEGRTYNKGDTIQTEVNGKPVDRVFASNIRLINEGASTGMKNKKSLYYIELPVPQDVNDQNSVTWGDNSQNILQLAGVAAASDLISKGPIKTFEQFRQLIADGALDTLGSELSMQRDAISAAIAGKAIDPQGRSLNTNAVLGRATGQILNNNLELLFDSVNLRSFPFSITFSPRNEIESRRVIHIIRALKSSMAAKKGTKPGETGQGGIFLKAPDIFHLRYIHNGKDHPFLNSFKHCALTAMSVNYTNAGTFASYADGTPVSIQLNMTFKELNPIYHEDYDAFTEKDNLGVGY